MTTHPRHQRLLLIAFIGASSLLYGCGGGSGSNSSTTNSGSNTTWTAASLGEVIFKDPSLSASGKQACASCHVASVGHAQDNALPAQLGGPLLDLQGTRVSPTIRYLTENTPFYFAADGSPTGGFFFDGRVSSLKEQAGKPFLNPIEMAMPSAEAVVQKVSQASYADGFKQVFGADILQNPTLAFDRITFALQTYQQQNPEFAPYSSKYDSFLNGNATLSDSELRGLAVFNNPQKGNCQACHPAQKRANGKPPLFTDFTYDNLGVPRNFALQVNADSNFYDLGLCARPQGDLASRTDLCGAFKVPTLRNVALRKAFFHNGAFTNLRDVLSFYATRDTQPERWYPSISGVVQKFNDVPLSYQKNVNQNEVPFTRKLGEAPNMSEGDIDDLLNFLKTLTDGYQ